MTLIAVRGNLKTVTVMVAVTWLLSLAWSVVLTTTFAHGVVLLLGHARLGAGHRGAASTGRASAALTYLGWPVTHSPFSGWSH